MTKTTIDPKRTPAKIANDIVKEKIMAAQSTDNPKYCRCDQGGCDHKPGECNRPATRDDGLCQPCSDKIADDMSKLAPLNQPQR